MRPLRLTMQAFGPYADKQVVDFTAALDCGLFGIYGPTGSGKSSIFSAMSFALFGEPAKDDQDSSTLRSDHAKPDCLTEVELIFEVGTQRYLVRRRPEQMRPAFKGGGETKELHCAWLFDVTGMAVDEISTENPGRVIAEKKTTEVREEIEHLLGYGPDQFRQIVLLPQGRFEAFLTAKTGDRLKILRELFDVSLYKRVTEKLKEDAKAAEEKIRADRRAYLSRLEQEGFDTPVALEKGVEEVKVEQKTTADAAKAAHDAASLAEKELAAANQIEKAFAENTEAVRDLNSLEAKSDEIEKAKAAWHGATVARSLSDVDRATQVAREAVNVAKGEHSTAQKARADATADAQAAAKVLSEEKGKHQELVTLRERHGELKRHRLTLENAGQQKFDKERAFDEASSASRTYDAANVEHSTLLQLRLDKAAELKTAEATAGRQAVLAVSLQEVEQQLETARLYQRASDAVNGAEIAVVETREKHGKHLEAFGVAQQAYELAETALAGAQALHLAEKLQPGQPCPVCGSPDHPAITKGDAESAGLDSAFRQARVDLHSARQAESQASKILAGAQATLIERQSSFEALAKPDQPVAVLEEKVTKLKNDLQALGPVIGIASFREALEALEGQITVAFSSLEAARTKRDETMTELALTRQALETALASVPEELREKPALESAVEALVDDIRKRESALDVVTNAEQAAREKLVGAARDEENAAVNCAKALATLEAADEALAQRLVEHGLTPVQYQSHKAHIDRIENLQAAIDAHTQQLAAAKDRADRARKAIAGMERPEIAGLMAACEEAAEAREHVFAKAAAAKARADHLKAVSNSIVTTVAAIETAEAVYAPLGAIAAAFNGQNNAKMELETFAIAAMFDRVLDAANLRLRPMTSGRYTLERDNGKGAGRRGLGIAVHDVHTGRTRATATLSGGETFMAALALALGLSDVVESVSGGIRLDTIFIDEGFSSLDPETLDQALQTLQDIVGESRAVGLISHVELVQQAIPNGFQISKTVSGSHVAARSV